MRAIRAAQGDSRGSQHRGERATTIGRRSAPCKRARRPVAVKVESANGTLATATGCTPHPGPRPSLACDQCSRAGSTGSGVAGSAAIIGGLVPRTISIPYSNWLDVNGLET